jgi:Fe2+ transport system protein FeoA
MWRSTVVRLEELGVFNGQLVEKTGALGRLGAVIVKAGGSRVALSRDISGAVIVATVPSLVRSITSV